MNILDTLEEGMTYEVLISTENEDKSRNIKPFGLKVKDNLFFLKLFPNRTFFNIKRTEEFTVYFLHDVLIFAEALTSGLDYGNLLDKVNYEVGCKVLNSDAMGIEDAYGKNVTTTIMAKPLNIIEHKKSLPIINRASNHIMELLVDFSRYDLMDVDAKNNFIQKVDSSEKIIGKTGNKKHLDSLNLIKKELGRK